MMNQIIPKLCGSCYVVRLMFHIRNIPHTVKRIYIAYFRSVLRYEIIFLFSSSLFLLVGGTGGIKSDSKKRYLLYKRKLLKLWLVQKPRSLYKRSQILPRPCKYIFSLMTFIINNQENIIHFRLLSQCG
jgi:hypothetical protein